MNLEEFEQVINYLHTEVSSLLDQGNTVLSSYGIGAQTNLKDIIENFPSGGVANE